MVINQESLKIPWSLFLLIWATHFKKKSIYILKILLKSILNMLFFNVIDINSKNMFILIIKLNNI
jgi:hypothetical protein